MRFRLRRFEIGLASAVALTAAAAAAAATAERPVVAELKTITIEASQAAPGVPGSIASLYPPDARAAGVQGAALLRCAIAAAGRFDACTVVEEEPADQGFAGAALRASTSVRQPIPDGNGGVRTEGDIYMPFLFSIREREGNAITLAKGAWLRVPSGEDMAQVYPLAAQYRGLDGRAVVSCEVGAEGRLTQCRVVDESPHGAGFGRAALALTDRFQMRSAGKPVVGGHVRIPIIFSLPR